MEKVFDNKIFNLILLLTIIGEFAVPFILKHFYDGYSSKSMVMSAIGNPESPVRHFYNAWLIWLGIFLAYTSIVYLYHYRGISHLLSILIFLSIFVFAIGAGLLAGIFSVNESKEVVTVASKIHGAGAAIGFMTLLFFSLFIGLAAFKEKDKIFGIVCIGAFILAIIFFTLFIMGDKEEFKNTIIAYEGLWERLTLFSMYIPFIYKSLSRLII